MKKNKSVLMVLISMMILSLYGCNETVENPKYVVSEVKPATAASEVTEKKQEASSDAETKKKINVSENEQDTEEKDDVILNESIYPYPDDIKDSNVKAMKNSDNTVRLTFLEGKFAITLPEELEDHFIIRDGYLSSKKYFDKNNGAYGKMVCFSFSDGVIPYDPDKTALLGKSGETYMWGTVSEDNEYKTSADDESIGEFELIESSLKLIFSTSESCNEKTNKTGRIFDVADGNLFKGEVIADGNTGFSDNDIKYGSNIAGKTSDLAVEQGLGVVAKKAVRMYDGTYFDCYNSADGTHYGWLCDTNIHFFFND